MLTVCLVPANVYSVQLYCAAVHSCQDSHYRLHFSVPLATIRGELLVSATDIILSGYSALVTGQDLFVLMPRTGDRRRRDAGPLGAIIFTLRPPRELFISTCCPAPALTISKGGDHMIRPMRGRGWGDLTNQRPGYSASQLLTTNFIAIAEIMLV